MTKEQIEELRRCCREDFYEKSHGADANVDAIPVFTVSVDMACKVYVRANSFGEKSDPLQFARAVLLQAIGLIVGPGSTPTQEDVEAIREALARMDVRLN